MSPRAHLVWVVVTGQREKETSSYSFVSSSVLLVSSFPSPSIWAVYLTPTVSSHLGVPPVLHSPKPLPCLNLVTCTCHTPPLPLILCQLFLECTLLLPIILLGELIHPDPCQMLGDLPTMSSGTAMPPPLSFMRMHSALHCSALLTVSGSLSRANTGPFSFRHHYACWIAWNSNTL